MYKKIADHFRRNDPVLFAVLQKVGIITLRKSTNPFEDLVKQIINQQLSDKAGETIYQRFKKLFPKGKITPKGVLKIPTQKLRKTGPSTQKIRYIKGLAGNIVKGELVLKQLEDLDDEAVIIELTKIKGIGRWTAEMFLMLSLSREDIFSHGDLGLMKGIKRLYNLEKPSREEVEKIAIKWSPYRSYASHILWRSLDS